MIKYKKEEHKRYLVFSIYKHEIGNGGLFDCDLESDDLLELWEGMCNHHFLTPHCDLIEILDLERRVSIEVHTKDLMRLDIERFIKLISNL